jgi:putative FmdB family regulatory protein
MPIYEYICDECGAAYERIVLKAGAKVACPKCSSTKNTIQLSVFAAHNGNGAKASSSSSSAPSSSGGGCCGSACGCKN